MKCSLYCKWFDCLFFFFLILTLLKHTVPLVSPSSMQNLSLLEEGSNTELLLGETTAYKCIAQLAYLI